MQVASSTGGTVSVTLLGVADVANMLMKVGDALVIVTNEQLIRAGALAVYEVQQSIMGNRGEPKSVDTGNFANSIQVKNLDKNSVSVFSEVEYAPFLEYGTSRMQPRLHFQNTAFNITPIIKEQFNAAVKSVTKK